MVSEPAPPTLLRRTEQDARLSDQSRAVPDTIWLCLVLLLALVLRIISLNGPLWFDEVVTVETHLNHGWGEMLTSYSMNHHYLHNLAAKASMTLFGSEPWAIRLPAMLFGLAGIAAMWWLARDLAGAVPAHATALLMALSYHHIWFSQNARGYTGLALFSTLGVMLFLRGLRSQRRGDWLWFGATMAATIFTHLTGAFLFMVLGLIWLALVAANWLKGTLTRDQIVLPCLGFLVGTILTIALYSPVLPSLLSTVSGVAETSAGDPMQEYQNPLWTAYEAIRTGVGQAGPVVTLVGLAVLGLSGLGAISLRKRAPLFAWITFGHIALTVGLLLAVGMRIWPRFFFTDIPFLLFLIVMGVLLVCQGVARLTGPSIGRLLFPAALIGMVAVSAAMAARNYMAPKQDLAGAVDIVEHARAPGERVYAITYSGELFTGHFKTDWATIWTEADYRAAVATPGPLTIVVTFPDRNFRSLPEMQADLDNGTLSETHFLPGTLGDGGIAILHRN